MNLPAEGASGVRTPVWLDVDDAAELMTKLGYPVSRWTLKAWRRAWIRGEQIGPTPFLLNRRRLRYEEADVKAAVRNLLEAARRAASGDPDGDDAPER